MTTYSQRQELEQQAQQLAAKRAMWQSLENASLLALGVFALGLMFTAYLGV